MQRDLESASLAHVAGGDEVGMVPLAGPVVAAAVIFPPNTEIQGIDDSKGLDPEVRLRLEAQIRRGAAAIGIGVVEVEEIDRLNIYHAGLRATQLALGNLTLVRQTSSSTAARSRSAMDHAGRSVALRGITTQDRIR